MAEKQAGGFGQSDASELFIINQPVDNKADQQITLEIAQAQSNKLSIQKKDYSKLSGNRIIDTYHMVNDFLIDHTKIKIREKATFFRLLAVMTNAGLSLIRSLKSLAVQLQKNPKLGRTLFEMAATIESGKSLSDAMSVYPDIFNDAEIGMIKGSEASGQLNKSLLDMADNTEKIAAVSSKVKGALVYPIGVMILLTAVMFVMMLFVIPQMAKLFTESGNILPLPTRILIDSSNFMVQYWYLVILATFGLIEAFILWRKTRSGILTWDYFKLKIPIFGPLMQKAILSRFARSFSSLLSSGVPIIRSLEIVADAVNNEKYKEKLMLTAEDMRRGIPLAENMADSKLFPDMFVNMIEVGEQTAQLENVMVKIAEFYDEDVDNATKSLAKIMEPLIIVIVGVMVGGLVAAIMLPIIQLTNISGGGAI